jgi:hypothetical protein
MTKFLLVLAVGFGLLIAYVDSRPNWDDTGLVASAIVAGCGLLGLAEPRYPWLWALAVGVWIPAFGIVQFHNYGSLLALAFAFAGAYSGAAFRKILAPAGLLAREERLL